MEAGKDVSIGMVIRERGRGRPEGWMCVFVSTDLPFGAMAFETVKLNSDWENINKNF